MHLPQEQLTWRRATIKNKKVGEEISKIKSILEFVETKKGKETKTNHWAEVKEQNQAKTKLTLSTFCSKPRRQNQGQNWRSISGHGACWSAPTDSSDFSDLVVAKLSMMDASQYANGWVLSPQGLSSGTAPKETEPHTSSISSSRSDAQNRQNVILSSNSSTMQVAFTLRKISKGVS